MSLSRQLKQTHIAAGFAGFAANLAKLKFGRKTKLDKLVQGEHSAVIAGQAFPQR